MPIKFSTNHKVYASGFIEDNVGVTYQLPFDADYNNCVHVKGLIEVSNPHADIMYNTSTKVLTAKEFIEED